MITSKNFKDVSRYINVIHDHPVIIILIYILKLKEQRKHNKIATFNNLLNILEIRI